MEISMKDIVALVFSGCAVIISVISLIRTGTSISVFREKSTDSVTITHNSPHAVTIIEFGVVTPAGNFEPIDCEDYSLPLPHRLDARDIAKFEPKTFATIARTLVQMNFGREGTYFRMAGGNFFGSKGKVFSDVGFFKRRWWWLRSKLIKQGL
jgi:hypothetical protein